MSISSTRQQYVSNFLDFIDISEKYVDALTNLKHSTTRHDVLQPFRHFPFYIERSAPDRQPDRFDDRLGGCLSGGMARNHPRFQPSHINKLTKFAALTESLNIDWRYGDFRDTIPRHGDDFLFLDPPYDLGKGKNILYGVNGEMHEGFDHQSQPLQNDQKP